MGFIKESIERCANSRSKTVVRYSSGRTSWDGKNILRFKQGAVRVFEIPGDPRKGEVSLTFNSTGGVSFNAPTANYNCFDLGGITVLECITEQRPFVFLGRDFRTDQYQVDPTVTVTNEYPFRRIRRILKTLTGWRLADEVEGVALKRLEDFKVDEEQRHQEVTSSMRIRRLAPTETGGKTWEDLFAELNLSRDELCHPLPVSREGLSSREYTSLAQKEVIKRLSEIALFAIKSNKHCYGSEGHYFIPLDEDLRNKPEEEIVKLKEEGGYKVNQISLSVDLHPIDPPSSFPRSFLASPTITLIKREPVLSDGTRWVAWKQIYWWIKKEKGGEYIAAMGEDKRYRLGPGDLGTVETEKDYQVGNTIELADLLKSILVALPKE